MKNTIIINCLQNSTFYNSTVFVYTFIKITDTTKKKMFGQYVKGLGKTNKRNINVIPLDNRETRQRGKKREAIKGRKVFEFQMTLATLKTLLSNTHTTSL